MNCSDIGKALYGAHCDYIGRLDERIETEFSTKFGRIPEPGGVAFELAHLHWFALDHAAFAATGSAALRDAIMDEMASLCRRDLKAMGLSSEGHFKHLHERLLRYGEAMTKAAAARQNHIQAIGRVFAACCGRERGATVAFIGAVQYSAAFMAWSRFVRESLTPKVEK